MKKTNSKEVKEMNVEEKNIDSINSSLNSLNDSQFKNVDITLNTSLRPIPTDKINISLIIHTKLMTNKEYNLIHIKEDKKDNRILKIKKDHNIYFNNFFNSGFFYIERLIKTIFNSDKDHHVLFILHNKNMKEKILIGGHEIYFETFNYLIFLYLIRLQTTDKEFDLDNYNIDDFGNLNEILKTNSNKYSITSHFSIISSIRNGFEILYDFKEKFFNSIENFKKCILNYYEKLEDNTIYSKCTINENNVNGKNKYIYFLDFSNDTNAVDTLNNITSINEEINLLDNKYFNNKFENFNIDIDRSKIYKVYNYS